jgi:hypothetical protein
VIEKMPATKKRGTWLIEMCSNGLRWDSLMNENIFFTRCVLLEVGGRRNFLFTFHHRHTTASRAFSFRFKSFAGKMSENNLGKFLNNVNTASRLTHLNIFFRVHIIDSNFSLRQTNLDVWRDGLSYLSHARIFTCSSARNLNFSQFKLK